MSTLHGWRGGWWLLAGGWGCWSPVPVTARLLLPNQRSALEKEIFDSNMLLLFHKNKWYFLVWKYEPKLVVKQLTSLHRQWLLPNFVFQVLYTDNGFHLKYVFKKRFSPQTMVLVLKKKFSTSHSEHLVSNKVNKQ